MLDALRKGLPGKWGAFSIFLVLWVMSSSKWELTAILGLSAIFIVIFGKDLILGFVEKGVDYSKSDNDQK
ncbi:hypothetical protein DS901_03380 [Loktanella sp. D2R18]|nr:hypothetical protein DS901_03380 [Loktanella sp. D2R18]